MKAISYPCASYPSTSYPCTYKTEAKHLKQEHYNENWAWTQSVSDLIYPILLCDVCSFSSFLFDFFETYPFQLCYKLLSISFRVRTTWGSVMDKSVDKVDLFSIQTENEHLAEEKKAVSEDV